jgi:NAD(P)-dependent dehydrogenase (short-subunit alcohol dehydrogenase family)
MKRVCLLTGASGTLGTAFIEQCAERYHVVAVHHGTPVSWATQDQDFVDPLCPTAAVVANSHRVHAIVADLREAEAIDRTIQETLDRFGQIDLLVNGAAVRCWSSLLDRGAIEGANDLLQVNVLAPLRFALRVAHASWCRDPEGNISANRNIVNVSSTAGLFVYPDLGQALYGTSKAALNHLTYHMASEFWDIGVRVNAVAPDTFPGRVATDDVVESIVNLDGSQMTGQVLQV